MSVRVLKVEKQDMKADNLHLSCFCNNVNLGFFFHIKSRRKINGITAWEKHVLPLSQGISYCVISIVICHKLRGGEGVQMNPCWDHPPKSSSSDK